ncbi:MAG: hypothetical protein KF898_08340 [Parachlamydiales bacterium]|nr:hypothetical protein [Candidatus Acheromyda pituitae]
MASLAISATRHQPQLPEVRDQANQEPGSMMDTVQRITPFVLGFIATYVSWTFFGLIPGLLIGGCVALVTSLANATICSIWDSCQHSHPEGNQGPSTPWYHQIVNWIPTSYSSSDQYPSPVHGHVGVGGGHFREHVDRGFGGPPPGGAQGHVGVGRGHAPQVPGNVGGPAPHGAGGHVGVGRGHVPPPGHGGMPAPHGAGGHVGVGGGHVPPPGHGGMPAPHGPGGHVGVGRGHFH